MPNFAPELVHAEGLALWEFLTSIDNGYIPSKEERNNLANILNVQLWGLHEIFAIPMSISLLTSLKELNLHFTQISDCRPLAGLTNLKSLSLRHTQISDCRPLAGLTNLEQLDLSNTQISDCRPLAGLTNLEQLDLHGLSLHSIPDTFQSLNLPFVDEMFFISRGINLYGVKLRIQPVSLFLQPRELVDAYFRSPKVPINEAKVLFLGDGGVGKTHTIRRIMNDCKNEDYQTKVTKGIEINAFDGSREGRQFNVNFWDFGGQDIMHAMHRCFLTERSLYVVLLSNRDNLTPRARFWLKNIQSFAKHSPVLLAVNRWENADSGALDMHGLRQEFPMLLPEPVYFYAMDPSVGKFHTLLTRILDEAAVLDSTAMSFPESWAKIRQELLDLKQESHYIPLTKYYELCEKNGISEAEIQSWLLDWFNDMGVCFSYHGTAKEGFDLDDYKVLEPKWATNAVYTLIHNGKEYAENGNILLSNIRNVLEKPAKVDLSDASVLPDVSYKDDAFLYILEVMRKFNLSYSVSPTCEFIPALCAENTPENIHPTTYREKLSYIMKYNYLPDTVIHRLMIRCYRKLNLEMAWRKGMRLEEHLMDLIAVVDMGKDDATLRIDIYANGDTPHWKLLNKLRNTLLEINRDLSLEAEDSILYPIDGDESPIPVKNILITKDNNYPKIQVFGKSGTMEFVSVDYLLGITFGENIVEAAEQTAMQEKQPFSQAIYYVTNHFGDVYSNNNLTVNNGESADQFLSLIDKLVEHNCHRDDTLIQALISSLEKDGTPEAKAATEVVKQAKNERKNVLKALGDHMKSVTNIVNGAIAARKVIKYIPTLIDTVKPWAEENLPEIAEWIQNLFP